MQIINDVLDFSKLSCGKMGVSVECFSVKDMMTNIIKPIVIQRIKEKRQIIEFDISANVPEFVVLDKQKLIQIIINLISNANKYSGIGKKNINKCIF
jgi:signal transduction histidine kinase